jgi:hypothetical protein
LKLAKTNLFKLPSPNKPEWRGKFKKVIYNVLNFNNLNIFDMKNNKFLTVLIVLVLSFSVGFAQTTFNVQVINSTTEDYECSAGFTNNWIPNNSGDMVFEVPAENMVVITYTFDEDDVSLEKLKCYYAPNNSPPDPCLYMNNGYPQQANVAPNLGTPLNPIYNIFKYVEADNVGGYDIYYFRIDPS